MDSKQAKVEGLEDIAPPAPPEVVLAQEAFTRDLPELLKRHAGQWVAYHKDQSVAFASNKSEVIDECHRQGHDCFLVRRIRPYPKVDFI